MIVLSWDLVMEVLIGQRGVMVERVLACGIGAGLGLAAIVAIDASLGWIDRVRNPEKLFVIHTTPLYAHNLDRLARVPERCIDRLLARVPRSDALVGVRACL